MAKQVTVGDLKDQLGMKGPRPALFCARCNSEFSAHAGDYFMLRKDEVLMHCKAPLRLMLKTVTMTEVEAKQ